MLASGMRGGTLDGLKILFIGDIVGEPGRRAVSELLPRLRRQHGVELVIANGENSAGGSGITPKTAEGIFAAGVGTATQGGRFFGRAEGTHPWLSRWRGGRR